MSETIKEQSLDVLSVTETWHIDSSDIALRLTTPDGFAVADAHGAELNTSLTASSSGVG